MQLVSETSTNPRINGKAATMSRLYSITPPGLLVGRAIDPMKGECECINRAYAKQAFCNRRVGLACKNQDYMCYRAMMRVRKLSLVRCLVWVVVLFGSEIALAKTDGSGDPGWPREHARGGNRLLVYQPPVDDWKNFHDLTGRMAVSLPPKGGKEAVGVPNRVTGSPSPTPTS